MSRLTFGRFLSRLRWKFRCLTMIPRFPSPSRSAPDRHLPAAGRPVPVVGWRTWKVRPSGGAAALESLYSGDLWDVGATHARCRRCPPWMANLHPVPAPSCECGLYAFSTMEEALQHLMRQARTLHGCGQSPPVAGAVIGWGRVVQHARQGWRSERARPVALLDTGHPLLDAAARHHNVPVVSARGLRLLPLEYGELLTR